MNGFIITDESTWFLALLVGGAAVVLELFCDKLWTDLFI